VASDEFVPAASALHSAQRERVAVLRHVGWARSTVDRVGSVAGRAGLDEGGKQMTDAEIKNLRDLMRAATPGPWRHEAWGSRILDSGVGSSQLLIATVAANTFRDQGRHNAEFIAACNPVAIRALLDRLKAAEGENERLRADAARLDHIEKHARYDPKIDGNHAWWPTTFENVLRGPTLRAAIDAAMKEKRK